MTTHDARIENGKVVLTPEQAADLGLREGEVLPVTIAPAQAQENPFLRWVGAFPPLPDGQNAVSFTRELRGGDDA